MKNDIIIDETNLHDFYEQDIEGLEAHKKSVQARFK